MLVAEGPTHVGLINSGIANVNAPTPTLRISLVVMIRCVQRGLYTIIQTYYTVTVLRP